MINFDSLTLKLFSEENKDFFIGGKIQKIRQPNRNELVFSIRNFGETKKLYINFNPNFYHICFMSAENEQKRNIIFPKSAPMFCMLLRKYIQNAKIINVEVPKYERIFEIYFEYYDELNEKSLLCLAIELMGKYSNVILYNYDTNVIIGCAHNVSSEKSRERELCGMLPYIYPVKQKKKNLLNVSYDSFKENVDANNIVQSIAAGYYYLTIPFTEDIVNFANKSKKEIYQTLIDFLSQKKFTPYIAEDYSKFMYINFEHYNIQNSVNEMIDNYFSFHQSEFIKTNLCSKILKHVKTRLLKLTSVKEKQQEQINKLSKGLLAKQKADIIMANIYLLKQGMKTALLCDFDGNKTEIELDENKTPVENANKYYAIYKKTKSAFEHAGEMIKETNSQILYFEELKFYVENSTDLNELNEVYAELEGKEQNTVENKQIVEFIEFKGVKIYIGKNKRQNDYILSKISSPEDIWFHPLNAAGAHILVKLNNSKQVLDDETVLKAAKITKDFSSQKNNSKTSIIYTKRKYVKKAKNKQAFVTYKNETEIVV